MVSNPRIRLSAGRGCCVEDCIPVSMLCSRGLTVSDTGQGTFTNASPFPGVSATVSLDPRFARSVNVSLGFSPNISSAFGVASAEFRGIGTIAISQFVVQDFGTRWVVSSAGSSGVTPALRMFSGTHEIPVDSVLEVRYSRDLVSPGDWRIRLFANDVEVPQQNPDGFPIGSLHLGGCTYVASWLLWEGNNVLGPGDEVAIDIGINVEYETMPLGPVVWTASEPYSIVGGNVTFTGTATTVAAPSGLGAFRSPNVTGVIAGLTPGRCYTFEIQTDDTFLVNSTATEISPAVSDCILSVEIAGSLSSDGTPIESLTDLNPRSRFVFEATSDTHDFRIINRRNETKTVTFEIGDVHEIVKYSPDDTVTVTFAGATYTVPIDDTGTGTAVGPPAGSSFCGATLVAGSTITITEGTAPLDHLFEFAGELTNGRTVRHSGQVSTGTPNEYTVTILQDTGAFESPIPQCTNVPLTITPA